MSNTNKERGYLEIFLITLVVAGLPIGLIWIMAEWSWFYFILVIAIIALFIHGNQSSL